MSKAYNNNTIYIKIIHKCIQKLLNTSSLQYVILYKRQENCLKQGFLCWNQFNIWKLFFLQIYLRTWKGIDLWFLEFWMNPLGF